MPALLFKFLKYLLLFCLLPPCVITVFQAVVESHVRVFGSPGEPVLYFDVILASCFVFALSYV
jgi:hypothetical protein